MINQYDFFIDENLEIETNILCNILTLYINIVNDSKFLHLKIFNSNKTIKISTYI